MYPKKNPEKGQALILIVAAIIGLLALTALAIDAGNVFSDRRHAQNAADTAALAAALAKVRGGNLYAEGLAVADINEYYDEYPGAEASTPDVNVEIYNPPVVDDCNPNDTPSPYAGNEEYIQVIIRSDVNTFFSPIVGIDQLHNCVESIAKAKPSVTTPLLGSAVAAISCTGYRTLIASGSTAVTLQGGGAFSNSNDPQALYVQKSTNLVTPIDKGLSAVGGIGYPSDYPSIIMTGLPQLPCPLPDYVLPHYTCDYNYVNFPPAQSDANVTWSGGVANLAAGIYCISGSFPKSNLSGSGVTLVMLNQGLSWNGGVDIHLSAPTTGPTQGLLIYLPYSNTSTIKLNGTAGMDITGSVLAPASNISLSGDFANQAMHSQWIGNTVDMSGSLNAIIQYDPGDNYGYPSPPVIELAK